MNRTQALFEQYAYTLDALADEPDCDDPASRKRLLHACASGMREAALGLVRYEAIREGLVYIEPNEGDKTYVATTTFYGYVTPGEMDTVVDAIVEEKVAGERATPPSPTGETA